MAKKLVLLTGDYSSEGFLERATHNHEESMIWRLSDIIAPHFTATELEIQFTWPNDVSFRTVFTGTHSRSYRKHQNFTITIRNEEGQTILSWRTGAFVYACRQRVVYQRATASVGLYDAAFSVKLIVDGEYVAC